MINVEFAAKQINVTPQQWMQTGQRQIMVQHGTKGTVQRVYGNYHTMQRVHAYDTVVRHQPYHTMRRVLE